MTLPPEYDAEYYEAVDDWAGRSAEVVVPLLEELVHPRTVVDVGCGRAAWAATFAERGTEAWGIDGDGVAEADLRIPLDRFVRHDLTQPIGLGRRFDLALCLEVGEHLPASAARILVASLTELADAVAFSAAIPYQGGVGHLNERWPSYWAARFDDHGFVAIDTVRARTWHDERVAWWYAQNLLLYVRRDVADRDARLRAAREGAPDAPLALVHPRRYLEWVAWGMEVDMRNDPAPDA
jgi:hypothetical protein